METERPQQYPQGWGADQVEEGTAGVQWISEKSLWCRAGGTAWRSVLRVLGNTVHREASNWRHSIPKLPKEGVCWETLLALACCWPLHTKGAASMAGVCQEGTGARKQNPFPLQYLCSLLHRQSWQRKNYLKDPDPFSQSSQKRVNLELRDDKLKSGKGSSVSRSILVYTSWRAIQMFCCTHFLDIELIKR